MAILGAIVVFGFLSGIVVIVGTIAAIAKHREDKRKAQYWEEWAEDVRNK